MRSLEEVEGKLEFRSNPSMAVLPQMGALRRVGGDVALKRLAALQNLSGLSNLETIGGSLYLTGSSEISSLGLGSLRTIQKNLSLRRLDALVDLDSLGALGALGTIGGRLKIEENARLQNFDALSTALSGKRKGAISIARNPELTSLGGLSEVGALRRLEIEKNASLAEIAGPLDLELVEYLVIEGNESLRSLEGFEKLRRVNRRFRIRDNPKLSRCDVLSLYRSLEYGPPRYRISGNDNEKKCPGAGSSPAGDRSVRSGSRGRSRRRGGGFSFGK